MTIPATTAPTQPDAHSLSTLLETISQADTGDTEALERLREVFRDMPEIARQVSDLAFNAESALLANVPTGARELFRQQASMLRRAIRDEGTGSALESMLIRRIVLDYVASLQADFVKALAPGETRPLELSRFYEQRADRAHRRFLASVESLARVRKLIVPIQINIAEQQVNVAGNVRTGAGDAP